MSEWEEDADEYIRKNLPSDIVWKLMLLLLLLLLFYIFCSYFWQILYLGRNFWMERWFIHCQKKCNKLAWCNFNVKGNLIKIHWVMLLSYYHSSFAINFYRGHQWRLPLTVYQLQPSVKKVKRTKEAISGALWGSYWCFHFCLSFPFLLIPICLKRKLWMSEFLCMLHIFMLDQTIETFIL